ncbi:unnamed protein product [Meganyctiphanes norvegica]|uniref:Uncharacterized protein n=1 Tax=Meganyctiphanes norvegica TaxID=48144 RepID=A0AAV2QQC9_MEGNR
MVCHGFRHLYKLKKKKKKKKKKLILAISADLETRLDSLACQIITLGPINISFGELVGLTWFLTSVTPKKKKKRKKNVQNFIFLTEFENRLDLPGFKLPTLMIK